MLLHHSANILVIWVSKTMNRYAKRFWLRIKKIYRSETARDLVKMQLFTIFILLPLIWTGVKIILLIIDKK